MLEILRAPGNLFVFDDVPQPDERQIVYLFGRIDEFIDIEFTDAPACANSYSLIVDRYDVHIVLVEINQLAKFLRLLPGIGTTNDVNVIYVVNDAAYQQWSAAEDRVVSDRQFQSKNGV